MQRALITGGLGLVGSHIADALVEQGVAVVVLDDLSRGRHANVAWAQANGDVRVVEGDIRDRDARRAAHGGRRRRVPPGRDADHAVRRGAAARGRRPGRRDVERARGRGAAPASQGRRRVVGVGLRHGERFPTPEDHHPYNNDTFYGAAKVVQRGHAAQLPRDVRPRLRGAALLQRVRPADGRPRRVHRGAGPLDGAHRRGRAAADLRRRRARRWTSSTSTTSPGRTSSPRPSDVTDEVFNVASGAETSLARAGAALLRVMGSDLSVEHGPERAVNGVARRLADTSAARARARVRAPRSTWTRGCAARRVVADASEQVAAARSVERA